MAAVAESLSGVPSPGDGSGAARLRRVVLVVAGLNLAYFFVEFVVALGAGSVALLADSVDFLEDAAVNLLIFIALGWPLVRRAVEGLRAAGQAEASLRLEERNRSYFTRAQTVRGGSADGAPSAEREQLVRELEAEVVGGVEICQPVDYKGDRDPVCIRCEGFAECTIRYVRGQPEEISGPNGDDSEAVSSGP